MTILSSSSKAAAATATASRSYCYFLDQRGRLYHIYDVLGFLCGTSAVPQGPANLKDAAYLNFFFQRLRRNGSFALDDAVMNAEEKDHQSGGRFTQDTLFRRYSLEQPWRSWSDFTAVSHVHRREWLLLAAQQNHNNADTEIFQASLLQKHCPWVSMCGNEANYMFSEDSPIVFYDLQWDDDGSTGGKNSGSADEHDAADIEISKEHMQRLLSESSASSCTASLIFGGGSLKQAFDPSLLRCSVDGKLYHPLVAPPPHGEQRTTRSKAEDNGGRTHTGGNADGCSSSAATAAATTPLLRTTARHMHGILGLVGPSVGLKLGLDFVNDELTPEGKFEIQWMGSNFTIPFL